MAAVALLLLVDVLGPASLIQLGLMAHVGERALVGQDLVLLATVHSVAALEHLSGDEALLFFRSRLSLDAALTTLDVTGVVRVLASKLIEVLMLDGLSSTDALVRVHLHHLAH